MAWTEPQYTPEEVDEAGQILLESPIPFFSSSYERSLNVINNWRSSHAFPLNTLQMGLRNKASIVDRGSLVAQRVKRLSAIHDKLERLKWLNLSGMQDLGGCRAIVANVLRVRRLVHAHRASSIKHVLVNQHDYIEHPKPSGYRSYHLIYRYYSDKKTTYNGLKIEIQIRSKLQHAWATAVETVGTFTQQALKSSQGEEDWLRFFALMGSEIALREKSPLVPGTPTNRSDLIEELREYATKLNVEEGLRAFGQALNIVRHTGMHGSRYFLLQLDPAARIITVTGYTSTDLEMATEDYLGAERRNAEGSGVNAVLVSAESVTALRRAFPNYFLDTRLFLNELRRALAPRRRRFVKRNRIAETE